jgi:hypothetical protein
MSEDQPSAPLQSNLGSILARVATSVEQKHPGKSIATEFSRHATIKIGTHNMIIEDRPEDNATVIKLTGISPDNQLTSIMLANIGHIPEVQYLDAGRLKLAVVKNCDEKKLRTIATMWANALDLD